jgi:hypothetical protein
MQGWKGASLPHPRSSTTRLIPPRHFSAVHIDRAIAPALSNQLRAVFPRSGLPVSETATSAMRVVGIDQLEQVPESSGPLIALVGGHLVPAHAAALRRSPPALLLASREPPGLPSAWELQVLRSVLTGEALLPSGGAGQHLQLDSVDTISAASAKATAAVGEAGGGKNAAALAADVMHELAANALFDAPVDANGAPKYAHRRGADLAIAPEDAAEGSIQVHGPHIFLSATDRFGRLTASPLAAAVAQLDEPHRVNDVGGGAGLGMRRIVEHSDLVAIRIHPGKRCQVVCAVELGSARRRAANPKSLFFWAER